MDKITKGFQSYFKPAATTGWEVGQYTSEEVVYQILAKLEFSGYSKAIQVCYVFGSGGQPKSVYLEMGGQPGVRVVHFESLLPRGLRFIPSYRGLVRIDEPSSLGCVFMKVMEQASATTLIFSADLEEEFIASVRNIDKHTDYSFGIKADPGYMLYLVDEDRDDSPTGMAQFLSYGTKGPWKQLFEAGSDSIEPF